MQTGSLRVRTELTKALSASNVLLVSDPPSFWSGFLRSGRYEKVPELKSTPPFVPISRVYSSLNLRRCHPAMNDVHEHVAGILDDARVIVVDVAVGLAV